MNKIKKVFVSLVAFIATSVSKIGGVVSSAAPEPVQVLYGPPQNLELTMGEKILKIGKIAIPVVLFAIGLIIILSKKISKVSKVIIISILILIGIAGGIGIYVLDLVKDLNI